jgi:hypothetical protein
MKKTIFIAFALLYASVIFGQTQRQQVAVWVEGSEPAKTIVAAELVKAISTSANYIAIERSAEFHKLMTAEIAHQQGGNVDNQVAQLGKQLGVQHVLAATITSFAGTNYVATRIINVQTGLITRTATIHDKFETIDAIINACETLASELLGIRSRSEIAQEQRGYTIIGGALYVQVARASQNVSYEHAVTACRTSRVGGYSDWRLPTNSEAERIRRRANEVNGIIDVPSGAGGNWRDFAWTSTVVDANNYAIYNLDRICRNWSHTQNSNSAICVRGQ